MTDVQTGDPWGGGGEDTKLKLASGVPERVPETGFEPWLLRNPGFQGCCEDGGRGWASDGSAARQAGPRAGSGGAFAATWLQFLAPLLLPNNRPLGGDAWLFLSRRVHLMRKVLIASFHFFLRFYAMKKTSHDPAVCQ